MLVNPSYFYGELYVVQTEAQDVQARLAAFIAKYEPRLLRLLVGDALCARLEAYSEAEKVDEHETEPPDGWPAGVVVADARLDRLSDLLRPILAGYIYFYYRRSAATVTTGAGEVEPEAENGRTVSPIYKMVGAWNDAVGEACALRRLLEGERDGYPDYKPCVGSEVFTYRNTFGL